MSYNPSDYTRCEKCKHIDRENEKCKITNDGWLVSDRAGTCHQFKGVKSMKVRCIDNELFKDELELNKEYEVLRVRYINGEKYFYFKIYDLTLGYNSKYFEVIEDKSKVEKLDNVTSRIDLVLKTDDFLEYDYKQDVIECRCPSEFGLKEYEGEQCNMADDTCCSRCWNELATKEEVERLSNAHKKQEFEENVKKSAEMLAKCSMSGEELFNNPIKPSHYQAGEFDVIAFCFKHNLDFASGNVVKYVTRAGKKDKNKELEDLYKGLEYLERKIEWVKANV